MSKTVFEQIERLAESLSGVTDESLSTDERMRIERSKRLDRIQGALIVRSNVLAREIRNVISLIKQDSYREAKRKLQAAQSNIEEILTNLDKAIKLS